MSYHVTAQRFTHRRMDEGSRSVRAAVLRLLHSRDCTFRDVINKLSENIIDEASIKAAVFRLSSEGRIEISPEWKVRRAGRGQK